MRPTCSPFHGLLRFTHLRCYAISSMIYDRCVFDAWCRRRDSRFRTDVAIRCCIRPTKMQSAFCSLAAHRASSLRVLLPSGEHYGAFKITIPAVLQSDTATDFDRGDALRRCPLSGERRRRGHLPRAAGTLAPRDMQKRRETRRTISSSGGSSLRREPIAQPRVWATNRMPLVRFAHLRSVGGA